MTTLDLNDPKHARASEKLRDNIIIWLGSVRSDGRPHLVPVWFLWDGATILIFSKPDQKISNLRSNPNVMLGLDDTNVGDFVVMVEGTAELLKPGEVDTTLPAYAEKHADLLKDMGWTAQSMSKEYTEAIRITPSKFLVWYSY